MNDAEKAAILAAARAAVEAAVKADPQPVIDSSEPIFDEKRGVFVTLKTGGRLRGCIGRFDPSEPFRQLLLEMAVASATQDPRFLYDRVTPRELPELTIEVSVLSPLERTDDPLSIELGTHGIYINKGFQSGCFLPQVATETGWSKEEFLSNCASHKAGLAPDAWRDPDTEVYIFTADILSEQE
jgi:AmmeMemoRadiSam system protein A